MRLLLIRHGDPDYEHDCLTEKGKREAQYLAERMEKETMTEIFVSPMGRAQETCSYTLRKTGRTAVTLNWLHEFSPQIRRPDMNGNLCGCWDWHPKDRAETDTLYTDDWGEAPVMKEGKVREAYDAVCAEFDALMAEHGYTNRGRTYEVKEASHDTLVFFCHFGVQCVILSHILNLPFVSLIHALGCAPTGVTELISQERDEGIAEFRMTMYGDISHLYNHEEEPSFTGRYCECYSDDTRH